MKKLTPECDLRLLRINNINSPQFSHLKWLVYWPVFGLIFWYAEHLYPVASYNVMYHSVDDMIPFNELFVLPYIFWFVYMFGMHCYTGIYDRETFRKMMKFIALTYSAGLVIFFLYPTCQQLRPEVMPRDNLLTRFMADFYNFDTSTNVCPSLHVIGSMSVMYAGFNAKGLQAKGWRMFFTISTFLISISTVFLKQHSVIDVVVGLLICLVGYPLCFGSKTEKRHICHPKAIYKRLKKPE